MARHRGACWLVEDATQELVARARTIQSGAASPFEKALTLVRWLGAHLHQDYAQFGFWAPEISEGGFDPNQVFLEVLTPQEPVDFQASHQVLQFRRDRLRLVQDGEYLWGMVAGLDPGSRRDAGALYWVKARDRVNGWQTLHDPLAYSLPFGAFAPAEFYDLTRLHTQRADRAYFAHLDAAPDPDGVLRMGPPTNILQVHPRTASREGTLGGLARIYDNLATKLQAGQRLTPVEEHYLGYDAVQLMPIEPIIEYEAGPPFWQELEEDPTGGAVTVALRRPDMTNWGYDILISGSPAVNPAVLGSRRPDEFVDLIATLHTFPGNPIKVILDIVYGHADNQALPLLNHHFFHGPGMYGQEINFRHPIVRAILLEMQRRKSNYGVDGLRVDGAQDFKYWDSQAQELRHDDDLLGLMNDLVQEVAGRRYRPWMIFEDGRPWPREDWELASTYREVTRQFPNVWQWGPLTFAHNTPFLFTFWISKRWRIEEMAQFGSHWITGCANHDTLRRGTQVDPASRINRYLGETLPDVFRNAYDNPAARLFDYVCMPGIPMDFINASMRAPWSFVRNTDERYGVKIVSEEKHFLDWTMDEAHFRQDYTFPRLKAMGFHDLGELGRFLRSLDHAVQMTGYDLESMVRLLQRVEPPLVGPLSSPSDLQAFARAWMDDVHELCNVAHYGYEQDPTRSAFNLAVRRFRHQRPWLRNDLRYGEHFDHLRPCEGTVLFFGLRRAPDDGEQVLFLANMEGAPRPVVPLSLPVPDIARSGWIPALATPGVEIGHAAREITLHNSQGIVYVRRPEAALTPC